MATGRRILDYFFYRLATWLDKGEEGGSRAGILLSFLWVLILMVPISYLLSYLHRKHLLTVHPAMLILVAMPLYLLIVYWMYRRYANRYLILQRRWAKEAPLQKTVGGVLVIGLCFFLVLLSCKLLGSVDFSAR
ncbi:hypothetical protein [Hymenobacter sp. BT730]|uniref:hypothetical protein n=1 Tax=Hymenobacter sp. BT730 TaxID=3063332 RepID=UPI0026E0B55B|nr:hypothetical protein [Hymenobacter sp. BT730]